MQVFFFVTTESRVDLSRCPPALIFHAPTVSFDAPVQSILTDFYTKSRANEIPWSELKRINSMSLGCHSAQKVRIVDHESEGRFFMNIAVLAQST